MEKDRRYALIGAHLKASDIEGVEGIISFNVEPVILSATAFDARRGVADGDTVRRALEARNALIQRETFIAIRYGVTVSGADEARTKCGSLAARWRRILEKRRGMVEVTLRVAPEQRTVRPDRQNFGSGSDYLRALHRSRASQLDKATRQQIEKAFQPFASELRWIERQDGGSELAALVRRDQLDDLRNAGWGLQKELPGTPFILSGPWPLETFADEET